MMEFLNPQQWKKVLSGNLPGEEAQLKMSPDHRGESVGSEEPVPAAVLVLIYPLEGMTGLVFMKRNTYEGHHSGQVSFPGGAWEHGDESLVATAIRETREEIGVEGSIEVLGQLTPLHIPVSNYLVTPYVGMTVKRPLFKPDPSEVQYVIEARVEDLMDPACCRSEQWELNGRDIKVPFYLVGNEIIWGATAMMLSEFLQLASRLQGHLH